MSPRTRRIAALELALVVAGAGLLVWAHATHGGVEPDLGRLRGGGPARKAGSGVILQRTRYDCGDAALAMILRRFGVEASYEDVHRELGTPPSGASMLSLRELARRRGLACEGWRLTPAEIDTMPLPALVLLRRSHYAVVEDRAASGAIVLVDPSFGRLTLSRRKFVSLWTGETLLFAQPGAAGAPPGTLLSFGRRIR